MYRPKQAGRRGWSVPWEERQRIYFRPPDVIDRAEVEAELAALGAAEPAPWALAQAFRDGVEKLLLDDREGAAALVRWAEGGAGSEEEVAAVAAARDVMAEHWPPYAALAAQAQRRASHAPVVAFQHLCDGWRGRKLPKFKRAMDRRIDLECMRQLDPLLIQVAGLFAYSLLYQTSL